MSFLRIMVFGTFDYLHQGHLNFFKQAKKLSKNSFLIVSVARDINVKKIKKRQTVHNERVRLKNIKALKIVDNAVLGGKKNYLNHIIKEAPDIIALGYDQIAYVQALKNDIKRKNLKIKIKRLKAYYPKKYKSSLMAKNINN